MTDKKPNGGMVHHFPVCPGMEGPIFSKFISLVDAGDWSLDKCWNWVGHKRDGKYGSMHVSGKAILAHRYAYQAHHGKPSRDMVLHTCDNPSCVNPNHLMEGNQAENMRQKAERKRSQREERHTKAVFSKLEVMAMHCLKHGGYTAPDIAMMFNSNDSTITHIVNGANWPDVKQSMDAMIAEDQSNG